MFLISIASARITFVLLNMIANITKYNMQYYFSIFLLVSSRITINVRYIFVKLKINCYIYYFTVFILIQFKLWGVIGMKVYYTSKGL